MRLELSQARNRTNLTGQRSQDRGHTKRTAKKRNHKEDDSMDNGTRRDSIDRRNFLGLAGATLLGATVSSATGSQAGQGAKTPKKRFRVVDTHFHIMNTELQG